MTCKVASDFPPAVKTILWISMK